MPEPPQDGYAPHEDQRPKAIDEGEVIEILAGKVYRVTAGEKLEPGDIIFIGDDGKAYKSIHKDSADQ